MSGGRATPPVKHNSRVAAFERSFVPHLQLRGLFDAIDRLRSRYEADSEDPLEGRAIFVVGESGAGKTHALKRYLERSMRDPGAFRTTEDGDIRPVVLIHKAHPKGPRDLVVAMLTGVGYPTPKPRETADEILRQVCLIYRAMGVQVVILDEAQHLVRGKGDNNLQTTREFVKRVLNQSGLQFVFVGIHELLALRTSVDEDRWDPKQIERRRAATIELRPYDWADADGRSRFLEILRRLQEETGLTFEEPLDGEYLAPRMYLASDGHVGLVSRYLSRLIENATISGSDVVGLRELGRAWYDIHRPVTGTERPLTFDAPLIDREANKDDGNPFLSDHPAFVAIWRRWALEGRAETDEEPARERSGEWSASDATSREDGTDAASSPEARDGNRSRTGGAKGPAAKGSPKGKGRAGRPRKEVLPTHDPFGKRSALA